MSFKVGDVVQLKSGGSKMIVLETNDAGMVMCTWLDSENHVQEKAFNQELLKRCSEGPHRSKAQYF